MNELYAESKAEGKECEEAKGEHPAEKKWTSDSDETESDEDDEEDYLGPMPDVQPLGLLADHIVCTVTSIQLGITLVMGLYLKAQANLDEGTTTA